MFEDFQVHKPHGCMTCFKFDQANWTGSGSLCGEAPGVSNMAGSCRWWVPSAVAFIGMGETSDSFKWVGPRGKQQGRALVLERCTLRGCGTGVVPTQSAELC